MKKIFTLLLLFSGLILSAQSKWVQRNYPAKFQAVEATDSLVFSQIKVPQGDTLKITGKIDKRINQSRYYVKLDVPSGFSYQPPFDIYTNEQSFVIDPDFDLEEYADLDTTVKYWVDSENGNDANPGTEASPFQTLTEAYSKGDADVVYLKAGTYLYKNQRPTGFTDSIKIIGLGSGQNIPCITADVSNQLSGSWTQSGNHYYRSIGDYVGAIYDSAITTNQGQLLRYQAVASAEAVDTIPGSFYWASSVVYVRASDDRAPDDDLRFYDNLSFRLRTDSVTWYLENLRFIRGSQFLNSSADGGTKAYFKDVHFDGVTLHGLEECLVFGGSNIASGDCYNWDARNGIPSNGVEYNVYASNYYRGDGSSQASTTHNGCELIRIGGTYEKTKGQAIADVISGNTWIVGSYLGRAYYGVGFLSQGVSSKLEYATIRAGDTALDASSGTTITYRGLDYTGNFYGDGTFTAVTDTLQDRSPLMQSSILSTTADLDFPSVASGSEQELQVSISGVRSNDIILLQPSKAALTFNLVYQAFVNGSDEIVVRATNPTAGAIDPTSSTFHIKIFK